VVVAAAVALVITVGAVVVWRSKGIIGRTRGIQMVSEDTEDTPYGTSTTYSPPATPRGDENPLYGN
jgi:hypothetical protein